MKILRARDRVSMLWKNGGGTTSEVAVFPPGASFADFGWRVSIAQVARGGPFSVFPGIERVLAIFEGRMTLRIAGRDAITLSPEMPPLAFAGDAQTEAVIVEGPVTDLNVMTRRGVFAARMTRRKIAGRPAFDPGATTLAFPLAGVTVEDGAIKAALAPGDALLAGAGNPQAISISAETEFYWIEIRALP